MAARTTKDKLPHAPCPESARLRKDQRWIGQQIAQRDQLIDELRLQIESREHDTAELQRQLATARRTEPELLTAEETAQLLRVRPAWVYAHAHELGGRRLLGESGPWRFNRCQLLDSVTEPAVKRTAVSAPHRRRRAPEPNPSVSLLPIKQRPF
ncbi:MAG: hypothetical protein ACRDLF_02845 [Solirubrobacteraceae bacterium]